MINNEIIKKGYSIKQCQVMILLEKKKAHKSLNFGQQALF